MRVGRPVGGSGAVPEALLGALEGFGGSVRTSSQVTSILCDHGGVRGVRLVDGTEISSRIVVSACDPQRTFVEWLSGAPPQARDIVARWRAIPHSQGYESKIDAIVTDVPRLRGLADSTVDALGFDPSGCTVAIAPSIAEMDRGFALMSKGQILDRPGLLANIPTALDPTMAAQGTHVLSLETLFTPYGFVNGWGTNSEAQRWLDQYATLLHPGVSRVVARLAGDDASDVRTGVFPATRSRHQLRRGAARGAAQQESGVDPL